jgi:hypothetical protein
MRGTASVIDVHPGALAMLVRAVAILALPYDGQVAWSRSQGWANQESPTSEP